MASLRVWGDNYNIREEGIFAKFPANQKYQLLDLGVNETIVVLPFNIGFQNENYLFEVFGDVVSNSFLKNVYYIAVGHRNDSEIIGIIEQLSEKSFE